MYPKGDDDIPPSRDQCLETFKSYTRSYTGKGSEWCPLTYGLVSDTRLSCCTRDVLKTAWELAKQLPECHETNWKFEAGKHGTHSIEVLSNTVNGSNICIDDNNRLDKC